MHSTVKVRPNLFAQLQALRHPVRPKMSWTCHGTNNAEMVEALHSTGLVKDQRAVEALRAVDRGNFCPHLNEAYLDTPQRLGFNATISAPHMHATAIELLKDHLLPGNRVLDVGSGSGYLTAVMAVMVRGKGPTGSQGKSVGIDHITELMQRGIKAAGGIPLANEMLQDGSLVYVAGDGMKGYQEEAPYDAIHVGASVPTIPDDLLEQLAPGGRLIVPVGKAPEGQVLTMIDKDQEGNYRQQAKMGVLFIPLQSRESQLGLLSKLLVAP